MQCTDTRGNLGDRDGIAVFGDVGASVYAVDAETGRPLWRDRADWLPTSRITGNLTVHNGVVYVPTGNQMTEPRVAESDAIMALDMKTGAKRWVASLAPAQMGGQDIYHLGCEAWVDPERATCSPENPQGRGDRDLVAPAILVERANGRDVLLAGSKDGMLYALDPDAKGKVVWQTPASAAAVRSAVSSGGSRAMARKPMCRSSTWTRTCRRMAR